MARSAAAVVLLIALPAAQWALAQSAARPNSGVYKWNGREWSSIPGAGVRITVAADGAAWLVQSDGSILRWRDGSFEPVRGKARAIAAGAEVWIIGPDDAMYRWNGQDWDRVPGSAVDIGVGADGSVWMVGAPAPSPTPVVSAGGSATGGIARRAGPAAGIPSRSDAGAVLGRSADPPIAQRFRHAPSVVPGNDSARFRFVTEQATVPIVEVASQPPEPGPKFDRDAVVAAAFPALAGKQTRHDVTVRGLRPATHYWFIVTIAEEAGPLITETGEFTTSLRLD